jgi:hypothetical protein
MSTQDEKFLQIALEEANKGKQHDLDWLGIMSNRRLWRGGYTNWGGVGVERRENTWPGP